MHNVISIHSLRMEGDLRRHRTYRRMRGFQSTPSAWRETAMQYAETLRQRISIHSLRMEGDYHRMCYIRRLWDFNPLPPHGGRLNDIVDSLLPLHFNPLPPHGGRLSRETFFSTCVPFQSTPSAWRETYDIDGNGDWITFQSTPSAWRETLGAFDEIGVYSISIHSLRMEGDTHNGYNLSTYD